MPRSIEKEEIEKGLVTSKRKVREWGGSKGITLSPTWLKMQQWEGRDISEIVMMGNNLVVVGTPDKEGEMREFIDQYHDWKKDKENKNTPVKSEEEVKE